MKLSKSFWQTLKESPSDAEIISHKLSLRAGLMSKSASGLYNLLPFGQIVVRKIENIIREEHEKINSQEIALSFVTPSELWKESGRWESMGAEMVRFKDRKNNDFCLSPTNEEAVVDVFRKSISSYKSLPVNLYQIKSKVRDEIRPRFGLMRCKEFIMKDAYSFSIDKASLDQEYDNYYKAYTSIFNRLGLEFSIVEADGGNMASGGAKTHEFQVIADAGEDLIVYAPKSKYAANIEKAQTKRDQLKFKEVCDLKEIKTKGLSTCKDVCSMLGIPTHQSLKTLVYTASFKAKEVNYMIMLLGDDDLNEIKLKNFLKADEITAADASVLKELELPKGFMSPLGKTGISIILDSEIDAGASYIVGANKVDFHTEGFTPSRDIESFKTADLRIAKANDLTLDGDAVTFKRGIEVGHIFQLGDKYTKAMGVSVLDKNGKKVTPLMGCYGIGITRTMASAIEQCHDDNGIIWPKSIAPFQIYFSKIGKKDETHQACEEIYNELKASGLETLYDDRGLGPGPMFKDADLLGLPIRVVFGERDFEKDKTLEIKLRKTGESFKVTRENLIPKLNEALAGL